MLIYEDQLHRLLLKRKSSRLSFEDRAAAHYDNLNKGKAGYKKCSKEEVNAQRTQTPGQRNEEKIRRKKLAAFEARAAILFNDLTRNKVKNLPQEIPNCAQDISTQTSNHDSTSIEVMMKRIEIVQNTRKCLIGFIEIH